MSQFLQREIFCLHLNMWNHHLMLGTCGKPDVGTLIGRFDLVAYRPLQFLVLRFKTNVLKKTFLIYNHIQEFVVRKFWTHDVHFHACFLQIVSFLWFLFSSKNEMGKCFSEQDLSSFRVQACIYDNWTVCSLLSYLSPSLPTEIAWRDGYCYSSGFMVWGTQKCTEIKTYRLRCTMLQLLTAGEELILVTVCDFLNGSELKTIVWFIVSWYSTFRKKKERRRILCRNLFLLLFLYFLFAYRTLVSAARNSFV